MTHRFFLPKGAVIGDKVVFPEEQSHQITHVLRLAAGGIVEVLDNSGSSLQVELTGTAGHMVYGIVRSQKDSPGEPAHRLTLYVSLTQRDKFEWVLQKCTELGVTAFSPFVSSRSLVQECDEVERKRTRWEHILTEAAEQSGRGRIPALNPGVSFPDALHQAAQNKPMAFILWENEHKTGLRRAIQDAGKDLPPDGSISIMVGPEGGFSGEEVDQACLAGMTPVSIGQRILRIETAAITATALVLYELGDMGE